MSIFKMASDTASRSFNLGGRPPDPSNQSDHQVAVRFDPTALDYDMTGHKQLLIFNHQTYEDSPYFKYRPPDRTSTIEDVKRLRKTFGRRGFEVTSHNDLKHHEILKELVKVVNSEHRSTSCLAIAILSHGKEDGMVYAADKPYPLSDVINMVLNQPSLAGKPKLFLVQACRGNNVDEGHKLETDGGKTFLLPTHSDFLLLRSCYDGYVSFRGHSGSWMIQSLCTILDVYSAPVDILNVIVHLNNELAQKSSSNIDEDLHSKKQTSETTFSLTKFLYI